MIKKMTDEILENPKERDSKAKSQDEAVSACKLKNSSQFFQMLIQILILILHSDSALRQSYGAHNPCQCHKHSHWIRCDGQPEQRTSCTAFPA